MSPHSNNFYSSFILYINITSELTDVTDSNKPVITPEDYTRTTALISADDSALLIDAASKFAVTPQTDGDGNQINWTISSDGKLAK